MPRRFEGFQGNQLAARGARKTEQINGILEAEKSRYRDKCSRAFSEFQYFTKEILSKNSELVGYFLVLN